jgi:hypothetical protein
MIVALTTAKAINLRITRSIGNLLIDDCGNLPDLFERDAWDEYPVLTLHDGVGHTMIICNLSQSCQYDNTML